MSTLQQGEDKPVVKIGNLNGNIFVIMAEARRVLKRAGRADSAEEMVGKVMSSDSYDNALSILSQYVRFE